MKLNSKTIVYTKEDMEGFCFSDVPIEKREERLQIILKKKYKNIKICCLLLIPSILLNIVITNEVFQYCAVLYDFMILFLLLIFCYVVKAEKRDYRKGNVKCHKIEIIKKLPVERIANGAPNAGSFR